MRVLSLIAPILLLGSTASALNPSLEINQYTHTAWTLRDGTFKGSPRTIAQTADGYLWIGTDFGVFRFDGVRVVRWQPAGGALPSSAVVRLLATPDGSLWIGTDRGLARWHEGKLTQYRELADQYIVSLLADRDGAVWTGTSAGLSGVARLCRVDDRGARCYGDDGTFGRFVLSLHEDREGRVWAGTRTGLWRWKPDVEQIPTLDSPEIHAIAEGENQSLVFAGSRQIKQLSGRTITTLALGADGVGLKPTSLLRDRNGGLWIGTQDRGLLHVYHGRVDRFSRTDGLSGDFVSDLFEDREGSIWVATLGGFDRFRELPVALLSVKHGLSTDTVTSLLADASGGVWLGTANGLNRWHDGRVTLQAGGGLPADEVVRSLLHDRAGRLWISSPRGLFQLQHGRASHVDAVGPGYVHAIVEDNERAIWVSDQDRGLLRLRDAGPLERIPWSTFGGKIARTLAADPRGGLWLGFFDGGIARFEHGSIRETYSAATGLGDGVVTAIDVQDDGAVWIATTKGLSRLSNGRVSTLTSRNGLPCDTVHWARQDDRHSLWLHTACGLVRILRQELATWIDNPDASIRVTVYDESDGVASYLDIGSYSPKVTRSTDGRLWFVVQGGIGIIDPEHIPFNDVPPPVHVEQVSVDGKIYDAASAGHLPPRVRDLRVDYTALSFIAPLKVRFRYRLDGRDTDWVDAGTRRQAFYSDLAPRTYRFRVTASNNEGVWNQVGAAWEFTIQPAFYQTNGFKVLVVLLVITLLWALNRAHMSRVRAQLNARFEARLAERTRIAQDLHDTLLQGFVSASMQLYVLADEVAGHPVKQKLERIVARVTQVIEEGRRAVEGLRSTAVPDDLEQALARDAEDFRGDQPVDIRVKVAGRRRPLQPLIRDDIYRLAREAMANAFKHACATRVELELEYASDGLHVTVRDNGRGTDPQLLASGRAGHWGIRGMRERADYIGASLKLSSGMGAGTEVALSVPARVAFRRDDTRTKASWFRRLRTRAESASSQS